MNTDFSPQNTCPCGSEQPYAACCAPFHQAQKAAPDAQTLMRSRYCAFALGNIDYIVQTTLPAQQTQLEVKAFQNWAASTNWLELTILSHETTRSKSHQIVHFHAFFKPKAEPNAPESLHDERSLFVEKNGRWYFFDHSLPLPTLKQPCPCGSNKKFKHCCAPFLAEE